MTQKLLQAEGNGRILIGNKLGKTNNSDILVIASALTLEYVLLIMEVIFLSFIAIFSYCIKLWALVLKASCYSLPRAFPGTHFV